MMAASHDSRLEKPPITLHCSPGVFNHRTHAHSALAVAAEASRDNMTIIEACRSRIIAGMR